MTRTKGIIPISANFEPQVAAPFDARNKVPTRAELLLAATWTALDGNNYAYVGMSTVVSEDTADLNGMYILMAADYTQLSNWKFVGSSSGNTGTETVTRTIYVEATGSDTTGDGLTVGTAFATIGKALSTIKPIILNNANIIVNVGIGTFNFTRADRNIINSLDFTDIAFITIQGTLVKETSYGVLTYTATSDPTVYTVNTTLITDELLDKAVTGANANQFHPVVSNTTNSICAAFFTATLQGKTTEVWSFGTALNIESDALLFTKKSATLITKFSITHSNTMYLSWITVRYCNVKSTTISKPFSPNINDTLSTVSINYTRIGYTVNTSAGATYFMSSSEGVLVVQSNFYPLGTARTGLGAIKATAGKFQNVIISSFKIAIVNNAALLSAVTAISTYVKCINCETVIGSNANLPLALTNMGFVNLITENTDYLFNFAGVNNNCAITILTQKTPLLAFFNPASYKKKLVELSAGQCLIIPNSYPEEQVQSISTSAGLTSTTQIGTTAYNGDISAMYSVISGGIKRTGSITITNDGTNAYISSSYFGSDLIALDASLVGAAINILITNNHTSTVVIEFKFSRITNF